MASMAPFNQWILTKTLIHIVVIVSRAIPLEQPVTFHVADKGCPLNGGGGGVIG